MPAVSIIVPTYKHRDYVLATLDSVFAQTFTDYELIVINDGSPDDTAAMLKPLIDAGRIRYVEQANAGQANARNRGLAMATGEFVAYLDDDDLWPSDKLAWQVQALRESDAIAVGGLMATLRDGVVTPEKDEDGQTRTISLLEFFKGNPFQSPGQVLVRTQTVREIGGFDGAIWGCDDLDLFLRLAARGKFLHFGRVALQYRFHAANASHAWERMITNSRKVFAKNIELLPPGERTAALRSGEWLAYCYASNPIQNGWSVQPGRVRSALRAMSYFIRPALVDPRLALRMATDCVPRVIRRTLRPVSRRT